MNREDIIKNNDKHGIKTIFYESDQGILGYSLGNTIYLNTNSTGDLELVSKHELFHFFEETEKFIETKELLLNLLKQNGTLEALRDEYSLKYYGLYTDEDIETGVIDTEIVIDLLAGNSKHSTEFIRQLGNDILNQVAREVLEKRYLVLNLRKNVASMADLSDWEKIFIENYYNQVNYDGVTPALNGGNKQEQARKDIQTELNKLYELPPETFTISPESKEVIREYESELKALETRGEGASANQARNNKEASCQELAKMFSAKLYEGYKHIVDFIKGKNYEDAFKALVLRETLLKTYKKDKGNILVGKRKLNETIKGHMVLNETTLDYMNKNVADYDNFANLYDKALQEFDKIIVEKNNVSLDNVETYGKGHWIKFEGKGSDPENYLNNAQELTSLVQGTPWCTKTLASTQLEEGDFYVFVDNENKPHIAVKLSGNSIDEVRGILNDAQELESDYRDVAISFLENNKNIKGGKEWYDKEEWNKRLVQYLEEINNGTFNEGEIEILLKDVYEHNDYKTHTGKVNSNLINLKEKLGLIKDKIARYYNCLEDEICLGDYEPSYEKVCSYRIILGNADFSISDVTSLGNLQSIVGNADFSSSGVTSLGNLQSIGGAADFEASDVTNLGNLQSIGGNATFKDSFVTSLGNLQSIGGNAYFEDSEVIDLGNLQNIGGSATFCYSNVINLGNLQNIGGGAIFSESNVKSLGKLRNIGEDAYLNWESIEDLGELENVGGNAYFNGSSITETGNLLHIGGNADFRYTKLTSLGNILSIDGDIYFENSQITHLGKLQSIGGNANFKGSRVINLGNLQSIEGDADFSDTQITDFGKLQYVGGKVTFDNPEQEKLYYEHMARMQGNKPEGMHL